MRFRVAAGPHFIRRCIAIGVIASLLIARRLWFSDREFPLASTFFLPPAATLSFTLLILLLASAVFFAWRGWRSPIAVFVVAAAVSWILDLTTFQPWLYQETLLLGCFLFARRGSDDALRDCRLILALTYIWSGLQKFFPEFAGVMSSLLRPFIDLQLEHGTWLAAGLIVASIETLIGAGLLLPRTRKPAAVAAIVMHLFVLLCIGPLGAGWNPVVWPWNLMLVFLVGGLFLASPGRASTIGWTWRPYRMFLLLVVGSLPVLSFVGWWDAYPSFSLYSGNIQEATIEVASEWVPMLPPSARAVARVQPNGTATVILSLWALADVRVPDYPEYRAAIAAFRFLCDGLTVTRRPDLTLRLRDRRTLLGAGESHVYGCPADSPE